jgi:hypothetical protein
MEKYRLLSKHRSHVDIGGLATQNSRARSSLAQREPARSTGGRPPQWHRHGARGRCSYDRVLPKSVPDTTKHTGGSRTHAHEHRGQWRESLACNWRLDRARGEGGEGCSRPAPPHPTPHPLAPAGAAGGVERVLQQLYSKAEAKSRNPTCRIYSPALPDTTDRREVASCTYV